MHPEVLQPKQTQLLGELQRLEKFLTKTPFYLFGGTALALQIGHRTSVDFDFLTSEIIPEDKMFSEIRRCLPDIRLERKEERTLDLKWKGVKLSFFSGITHPLLRRPIVYRNLRLLSAEDIAAMKIATVMNRSEVKDYFDLATLLHFEDFRLDDILKGFQKKYGEQSEVYPMSLILKTLGYTDELSASGIKYLREKKFWGKRGVKGGIEWIMDRYVQEYLKSKIA